MVAVVQLTAADFPEITFPEGTDLLQILWCVGYHFKHAPLRVVWRRASEVTEILDEPPVPDLEGELPGFYETYIPRPCVLHPERLIEYPHPLWDELPDDLSDRLQAWDKDRDFYEEVSTAPGFKVGGSVIHGSAPSGLECVTCGAPAVLLLQLDNGEGYGRWWPIEDRHLVPGTPEFEQAFMPTGMMIDVGPGGLFACSADPEHPVHFHRQ
jgi:hypothetical protein